MPTERAGPDPDLLIARLAATQAAEVTKLLERAEKLGIYDGRALDALLQRSNGHRGAGKLARERNEIDPRHDLTRSGWERDVLPLLAVLSQRGAARSVA